MTPLSRADVFHLAALFFRRHAASLPRGQAKHWRDRARYCAKIEARLR